MLDVSLGLVGVAVALGVLLAGLHLMELPRFPAWGVRTGYAHAGAGAAGLLALALAWRETGGFARLAAAVLALALAGGAVILSARLRRRGVSALLIGVHASVGIAGAALLAAGVATGQ